jgi:anthranilate synthase component 1
MNKGRAIFKAVEFVSKGLKTDNPDVGHR